MSSSSTRKNKTRSGDWDEGESHGKVGVHDDQDAYVNSDDDASENNPKRRCMSRTTAMHAHFESWYTFKSSSAKQKSGLTTHALHILENVNNEDFFLSTLESNYINSLIEFQTNLTYSLATFRSKM